jgi:hypothetical protein
MRGSASRQVVDMYSDGTTLHEAGFEGQLQIQSLTSYPHSRLFMSFQSRHVTSLNPSFAAQALLQAIPSLIQYCPRGIHGLVTPGELLALKTMHTDTAHTGHAQSTYSMRAVRSPTGSHQYSRVCSTAASILLGMRVCWPAMSVLIAQPNPADVINGSRPRCFNPTQCQLMPPESLGAALPKVLLSKLPDVHPCPHCRISPAA